ncbi:protein adenylyltransferase SelO [Halomonas sp. M20]|uniref:protein adenylyltransferase SelO n=1 Tax=Halomonas sp. M20 TaxID=2763264 RepID=UPI001D0AD761|nr:YdiU family protein [Halomonas sp. M20]
MNLNSLQFDNAWMRLPEAFYSRVTPTAWRNTRVLDVSPLGAAQLGLDLESDSIDPERLEALMAGRELLPGMTPIAQKYTGHQFGSYNPALGDGRGLLLGEAVTAQGPMDLHLKGAGQTPYSRFGDGRAVLRSSIREYLAGEAMSGLGIPTTTALAVAVNDERVMRERVEPGATLLRLSPSHARFGHFEWLYQRRKVEDMQTLLWHLIHRHRPEFAEADAPFEAFFADVVERTANLIAAWQAYGFVHAVMNTDNMSLLGLTLDYGPYAFMERYKPDWTPNHTDAGGRYAFEQQPGVGLWNLSVLAQSLTPLIDVERLREMLDEYEPTLQRAYAQLMRARLGLTARTDDASPGDSSLVADWLKLLEQHQVDFHNAFRALGRYRGDDDSRRALAEALEIAQDDTSLMAWLESYDQRLGEESRSHEARRCAMEAVNPCYVLRTHLVQDAIEAAAAGDSAPLQRMRERLASPFSRHDSDSGAWFLPPAVSAPPVCLSCSS